MFKRRCSNVQVPLLENPQRGKRKRGYTVSSPSTARFCRKHKGCRTSLVEWGESGGGSEGGFRVQDVSSCQRWLVKSKSYIAYGECLPCASFPRTVSRVAIYRRGGKRRQGFLDPTPILELNAMKDVDFAQFLPPYFTSILPFPPHSSSPSPSFPSHCCSPSCCPSP